MYDSTVTVLCAASALLLAACADTTTKLSVPAPDAVQFEHEVYPVLLRDCGFPACHGNPDRFFRIFGPGRLRFRPDTTLFDEATSEEIELTYERARSMLASETTVFHSALLRKPYQGGHKGIDDWGNNVYRSARDPGYQTLVQWAQSATASKAP